MQSITSVDALQEAIATLKHRRNQQELEIASKLLLLYDNLKDSLKPVNIIKNIFRELIESPGIQHRALNAAMGMVAGYLSRKLFVRSPSGILKKLFGAALQFGVTTFVGTRGDAIKKGGLQLFHGLFDHHNGNGSR